MKIFAYSFILLLYMAAPKLSSALEQNEPVKKPDFKIEPIDSLNTKAAEAFKTEDYSIAIYYYQHALKHYRQNQDINQAALCNQQLGDCYSEINDFDKALEYYLEALELAEQIKVEAQIAYLNLDLGKLFIKLRAYDKAINKLNLSLSYLQEQAFSEALINNYANLGVAYGNKGLLDSALLFLNKALEHYPDSDLVNQGGVLNNMGAIYYKQAAFKNAQAHYSKALKLFKSSGHDKGMGISLFNLAQIEIENHNNDSAKALFETAIPYLENSKSLYYLDDCYKQLSLYHEERGDLTAALKFHKQYTAIKDSILNMETIKQIAQLQMQHKVRKVEHQLELLEETNKRKEIQRYGLIGSIIILLIIGALTFRNLRIRIRNNQLKQQVLQQEKQQLKAELAYKSKELENFALQIVQKNEFLDRINEDIKTLDQSSDKLKEISVNIKQNLYIEKDREAFQLHLNKIHEAFFLRLKSKFPELTENDKKLCALLVIGLSSKDIATIINISPESVKKSRYRLRKKMGLTTDNNLTAYLKEI